MKTSGFGCEWVKNVVYFYWIVIIILDLICVILCLIWSDTAGVFLNKVCGLIVSVLLIIFTLQYGIAFATQNTFILIKPCPKTVMHIELWELYGCTPTVHTVKARPPVERGFMSKPGALQESKTKLDLEYKLEWWLSWLFHTHQTSDWTAVSGEPSCCSALHEGYSQEFVQQLLRYLIQFGAFSTLTVEKLFLSCYLVTDVYTLQSLINGGCFLCLTTFCLLQVFFSFLHVYGAMLFRSNFIIMRKRKNKVKKEMIP